MEIIVLAGGLGTRLREVSGEVPKSMVPVAGRPFLHYLLDHYAFHGATRFILSVGYLRGQIIDYVADSWEGIPVDYSLEEEPLGTGGGMRQSLEMAEGDTALVINGDTWFPINPESFMQFHKEKGALLSMALKELDDTDRYGRVTFNSDSTLTGFLEKKPGRDGLINGGIYTLDVKRVLCETEPGRWSFEKEFLEARCTEGIFSGKVFHEDFIDIGIPSDYEKAQVYFRERV
jgi:D-glycero-alpha-D-manno-heptose 1-phosphate guanylyltransferase